MIQNAIIRLPSSVHPGFGHTMMQMIDHLTYAKRNDIRVCLDDSRWFFGKLKQYFKSASLYKCGAKNGEYWKFPGALQLRCNGGNPYSDFDARQEFKNFFVLNDSIIDMANTRNVKDSLVVHFRLTDKIGQHHQTFEMLYERFEKHVQNLEASSIFVMSDEPSIRKKLKQYTMLDHSRAINPRSLRSEKNHLRDLLVKIEIAKNAKYFLGSQSGLSELIRVYRKIHDKESLML